MKKKNEGINAGGDYSLCKRYNEARAIMLKTKSPAIAAESTGLPVEELKAYARLLNLNRRGVDCA